MSKTRRITHCGYSSARSRNRAASERVLVFPGAPLLPTELIYEITTLALSDYLTDLFISPHSILEWDGITVLLQSTSQIRSCTMKLLGFLDKETFINDKDRVPRMANYFPVLSPLRQLSRLAYCTPQAAFTPPKPKFLDDRAIRRPITRFPRMAGFVLQNFARTQAFVKRGMRCIRIREATYVLEQLRTFRDDYMAVHAVVRGALLGRVVEQLVERLGVWQRMLAIELTVRPFFQQISFIEELRHMLDLAQPIPPHMLATTVPFPPQSQIPAYVRIHEMLSTFFEVERKQLPSVTKEELGRVWFFTTLRYLRSGPSGEFGALLSKLLRCCIRPLFSPDDRALYFDENFDFEQDGLYGHFISD